MKFNKERSKIKKIEFEFRMLICLIWNVYGQHKIEVIPSCEISNVTSSGDESWSGGLRKVKWKIESRGAGTKGLLRDCPCIIAGTKDSRRISPRIFFTVEGRGRPER